MSHLRKLLLKITALVALITTQTIVCVAQEHSPCEAYGRSIAIFVGKVIGSEPVSIRLNPMMGGGVFPARIIHYSVEERFKGDAKGTEEAVDGVSLHGRPDFKTGEQYLVYTFSPVRPYDPDLKAQRALLLSEAPAELLYLRRLQRGEPVASVAGKILQHNFDVANWKLTPVTPPVNVRIFLENSQGVRRETRTDENNTFRFNNIVPGVYKVVIDTPPKLYSPVPQPAVDLIASPCSHADFWLQSDGRVSGKVVDADGKPAIYVGVSLVPVELMPLDNTLPANRELHGIGAQANDQGRYEIRGVPPGRYLLGVNLGDGSPEPGWSLFPRTFYPGTPNRSQATVIELSEAGEKLNQDFQLPPRLITRAIQGSVVFSNGNPTLCAMVGLIDVRFAKTGWAGTQMRVEEGGRFTLAGVDGYKYAVQAFVPVHDKNGHVVGYLPAPPVEVLATEKVEPVRLVMPPEANCDFLLNQKGRP